MGMQVTRQVSCFRTTQAAPCPLLKVLRGLSEEKLAKLVPWHVCVCTCLYVSVCACLYVCMCAYIYGLCVFVSAYGKE